VRGGLAELDPSGFPGHATSYVEHSELIADGIVAYANLVGRENVIADADEGAALVTRRLWR
jgi:5-methyltetrahydropteroyltriglutamate--homocysteine methyltransferase